MGPGYVLGGTEGGKEGGKEGGREGGRREGGGGREGGEGKREHKIKVQYVKKIYNSPTDYVCNNLNLCIIIT